MDKELRISVLEKWNHYISRSGYFFIALLLNLVLFALLASYIVFKGLAPLKKEVPFQMVNVTPPKPPVQPPAAKGGQVQNLLDPNVKVTPPPVHLSVQVTTSPSTFFMNAQSVATPNVSASLTEASGAGLPGTGVPGPDTGSGDNPFGSSTDQGSGLRGYFYDLKQTSSKAPSGVGLNTFYEILTQFMNEGWRDSVLDKYFKSKIPLYAYTFAISVRDSAEAPKAFKLENEVQPSLWAVHYHGTVSPPEPGNYQFIGFADNVLVVRVGGQVVLDAGFTPLFPDKSDLHQRLPNKWNSPAYGDDGGLLRIGPSFHIGDSADMDVLIGDDGGLCAFYLLIMKEGGNYEKLPDHTPKVPFFQLGQGHVPKFTDQEVHPPFSKSAEPWLTP